jgi:hypothetical protein
MFPPFPLRAFAVIPLFSSGMVVASTDKLPLLVKLIEPLLVTFKLPAV